MAKTDTRDRILTAARECLLADGFAGLSTRKVALQAGVPLSQIHYHFGSKEELILALLRRENDSLLGRQAAMFASELPLWKRWDLACDFLDDDLETGYVRVLQEMIAAGWSSDVVAEEVRMMLYGWNRVLRELVASAEQEELGFGVFSTSDVVALISAAFLGAEAMILVGMESDQIPLRSAIRKVGRLVGHAEEITG
jgi:AcrR family transcriptional regulator